MIVGDIVPGTIVPLSLVSIIDGIAAGIGNIARGSILSLGWLETAAIRFRINKTTHRYAGTHPRSKEKHPHDRCERFHGPGARLAESSEWLHLHNILLKNLHSAGVRVFPAIAMGMAQSPSE
jgi:hypothetical protein